MSEFRQNPITKNWVLIAPARGKRPDQYKTYSVMHDVPKQDELCVFCPGKEDKNIQLARYDISGQQMSLSFTDWQVRVIANKFASLEKSEIFEHKEFYISHSGNGRHEVIITRSHNEPVALQSISLVELSIRVFIDRIRESSHNKEIGYTQLFHNHGRDAGASIIHPHYQLISTPIVPPHIQSEVIGCYHYFQNNRTCVYCDIIKEEVKQKARVLHESEYFIVLCPYASRNPFETWILPKKHGARFEDMSESEIKHLSFVLKVTLGQLYVKLSDPPLNFYIHNMPFDRGEDSHTAQEELAYHWHLVIFPRITIWAGFEFATGIPVNPMPPEEATKFLKGQ